MSTSELHIHARAPITLAGMALELVLAERPAAPQRFVTWVHNPRTNDYAWGHYFDTLDEARKDFAERLASYA
ncbi:MAG: hypothetical protein OWQ57_06925 [Sulfobacillus sp.]|nr:hypothetical protein [Sulfobacillus sp.]